MQSKTTDKVVTGEFRVSFPSVFKATAVNPGDAEKYSITMLIPKSDKKTIADITALLTRTLTAKWGADKNKWPKNMKKVIRDGDEEYPERDGYPGHYFIAARNKSKPRVVDTQNQDILDENDFYAGCYARASLTAFCYDKGVNKGVALSLQNVQKLRDGDRFTSRSKPEDDFGPAATPAGAEEASDSDML